MLHSLPNKDAREAPSTEESKHIHCTVQRLVYTCCLCCQSCRRLGRSSGSARAEHPLCKHSVCEHVQKHCCTGADSHTDRQAVRYTDTCAYSGARCDSHILQTDGCWAVELHNTDDMLNVTQEANVTCSCLTLCPGSCVCNRTRQGASRNSPDWGYRAI